MSKQFVSFQEFCEEYLVVVVKNWTKQRLKFAVKKKEYFPAASTL